MIYAPNIDPRKYPLQAAIELVNYYALDAEYRPYPFISHMTDVAYWTQQFTSNTEIIAAAWLHDLVEDFDVTFEDLRHLGFSDNVVDIVFWVTDPVGPEFETRQQKKAGLYQMFLNAYEERPHKSRVLHEARIVKACDRLANMTACTRDKLRPSLMKKYAAEWDEFSQYILHEKGELMIPRRLWTLLLGAKNTIDYELIPNEP